MTIPTWDVPLIKIKSNKNYPDTEPLDVYNINIPGFETTFHCPSDFTEEEIQEMAHKKLEAYKTAMKGKLPMVI